MSTDKYYDLCSILVADYLLKDKRFLPLYKEYEPNKSDVDDMVPSIILLISDIEIDYIKSHPEVVKDYIIYRLFIYACWKRIVYKLGDNLSYIDPDSNEEAIVLKEGCSLTSKRLYLNATNAYGSKVYAQLHIEAIPLKTLLPLTWAELLDYPVWVSIWRDSGRGDYKLVEVKPIGEITKSQILAWFTE